MPAAKGLTPKQELFVAEYLTDLNASRAVIAAGYAPKNADVTGSQLLVNPKVAAEIAKRHGKRLGKLEISGDWVLERLKKLASYDIRKLYDADGRCKPITELDDDTAPAITGMKTAHKVTGEDEDGMVVFTEYKLADQIAALTALGKHLKLFTEKVEHSGRVSLADLVIGSYPKSDEPTES